MKVNTTFVNFIFSGSMILVLPILSKPLIVNIGSTDIKTIFKNNIEEVSIIPGSQTDIEADMHTYYRSQIIGSSDISNLGE